MSEPMEPDLWRLDDTAVRYNLASLLLDVLLYSELMFQMKVDMGNKKSTICN